MPKSHSNMQHLSDQIKSWGMDMGFQQVGITQTDLSNAESQLMNWLEDGFHGEMHYMQAHGNKRSRPEELIPGTIRVISLRMDYLPESMTDAECALADPTLGYVSRYALGRDYHKLIRKRLQQLASRIEQQIGSFGYRVFVDSAPVLEKPLAEQAGLGWIGKHSNLINRHIGSWFFLGEIYTDLPLPVDSPASNHCGTCNDCMTVCPTQAIVEPYVVDARLCISYLTIELHGSIPEHLRPLIGNRIYGCDDCQLVCPWNRFAQTTSEPDFSPRHELDRTQLIDLFEWDEPTFMKKTEGSAIRRIGHKRWLRNIAVALGNAPPDSEIKSALLMRQNDPDPMVREHVAWALAQQVGNASSY